MQVKIANLHCFMYVIRVKVTLVKTLILKIQREGFGDLTSVGYWRFRKLINPNRSKVVVWIWLVQEQVSWGVSHLLLKRKMMILTKVNMYF